MILVTVVILGKEILEGCIITMVIILEVGIQVALGMTILEEVELGLVKESIQVILG